ncbi:MAG: tetratricopeptide repeat protein [Candidatus Eisenbacteria bacterium]|nr:tetratricopeptide repeat protein [Candidatus Eisenbacteria bacterium]
MQTSHPPTPRVLLCAALALLLTGASPLFAQDDAERPIEDFSDLPADTRLVLFEAQTLRDEGNVDDAASLLREFVAENPDRDHYLVRFHSAVSHALAGDTERALEDYRRTTELEPRYAQAWISLGELAYNLGRYELAAAALEEGYARSELRQPSVLFYRAASLVMSERSEEAIPILEELVSGEHGEPTLEWHRALVMAYLELEEVEKGSAALDEMLAGFGSEPEPWEVAFQYHVRAGDYENAAVALMVSDYLDPLTSRQRMQLGDIFLAIGVPAMAGDTYEEAMGDSATTDELERLASAHLASYQFREAEAALELAIEKDPTARLWSLLGDLHFMRSDYAPAYEAYESAAAADSTYSRSYLMMGYCAIQLERTEDALASLRVAQTFPDQADKADRLMAAIEAVEAQKEAQRRRREAEEHAIEEQRSREYEPLVD